MVGSNGWGSSISNWTKGTATTSGKVVSPSGSNSRLIIRGDSTVRVDPQAKGSSAKALGTSIAVAAGIAVTVGVSTIMASLSSGNGSGNSNLKPDKPNKNELQQILEVRRRNFTIFYRYLQKPSFLKYNELLTVLHTIDQLMN